MFSLYNISDEIKKNCKKILIETYGWTGSLSVISAYTLTSFESDELILIDILNLSISRQKQKKFMMFLEQEIL